MLQGFLIFKIEKMLRYVLIGFSLISSLIGISQEKGFVRGNIADGDYGGSLLGATISVPALPGVGTMADFDGNFSLALEPGVYTISVSFISYATQTFEGVEVKAGEVTSLNATMTASVEMLEAFEVTAEARRNTESAMLLDMKKATNVTDGLSSQTFRKVGDSELSGAMKRITGVTVQGGKYVYVRGLGDRYTKTNINGMSIPGLDPDNNSVQMDIFPTPVLENVQVFKTFSPNLDGDFTGGLVNITTKKFPETRTNQISVGVTYIPGMHFNQDYILYNGGKTDFTGFDDGTRQHPFNPESKIPHPVTGDPALESMTRSFNPELAVKSKTALPNMNLGFVHGNQKNLESGTTLGYNMVFNYKNESAFYEDFQANDYLKDNDKSQNELIKAVERIGVIGKNNIQWSGLLSGSWKKDNSSISATFLNSQSGESTATHRMNSDNNQNQSTLVEDILTYQQRTLSTFILNGNHRLGGMAELTWGNSTSYSRVYDPDFRETRISITDNDTTLSTGTGAGIDRFWRDLHEINNSSKVDLKITASENLVFKTGLIATIKFRDFSTYAYKHPRADLNNVSIDPDWYLQEENIWTAPTDAGDRSTGTFVIGNFQPTNQYEARQNLFGGYLLAEHPVFSKVKLVYGVRVEKTDMFYTGENNTGTETYIDRNTLDAFNVLPSLNAVYELNDKMNLRFAANRTVARPTFKEKSIAQIYDPITKRTFVGNIELEQTNINNVDLRYEFYLSPKELISVATFYKGFDGHIEMVSFPTAPDNIKPRNSGQAIVYGAEFEVRKSLGNPQDTNSIMGKFFISTNLSLVQSRVDLHSVLVDNTGITEYELRASNVRNNETPPEFRPMSGQSPYAANIMLSYDMPKNNSAISLSYNVQGEQLTIIGSGRVPDIYTIPFNSLNFNAYRNLGKKLQHRITLSVDNILNDDRTLVYKSFGADNQIFTTYKPGVGVGLKYAYSF